MKSTITLLIALVIAFVGLQATYVIDETNQAIITQFGQYVRDDREPGLYFKIPFAQEVAHFDKRVLVTDLSAAEYLTLDKKRVMIDNVSRWRIRDVYRFFVTVRTEPGAQTRLYDIIASELRQEVASYDFDQLIARQREPIMDRVSRRVADKVVDFGIEMIDVRIKRADLPQEVQASVFNRMVAERGRIAKRYRSEGEEEAAKIRAEADKESVILRARAYEESQRVRGRGDAEATSIYANAFGQDPEFYGFVRSLQAYEKFLADKGTMVLSTDSELFRYLASPTGSSNRPR
ncbi:MAG: protease modulator HflC [Chloroflexi bacterium]|nr:protease modulator HflC [Chloroflexota bacterium]